MHVGGARSYGDNRWTQHLDNYGYCRQICLYKPSGMSLDTSHVQKNIKCFDSIKNFEMDDVLTFQMSSLILLVKHGSSMVPKTPNTFEKDIEFKVSILKPIQGNEAVHVLDCGCTLS